MVGVRQHHVKMAVEARSEEMLNEYRLSVIKFK